MGNLKFMGYSGVYGIFCGYRKCRGLWEIQSLWVILMFMGNSKFMGYSGVYGIFCGYRKCRGLWETQS